MMKEENDGETIGSDQVCKYIGIICKETQIKEMLQ